MWLIVSIFYTVWVKALCKVSVCNSGDQLATATVQWKSWFIMQIFHHTIYNFGDQLVTCCPVKILVYYANVSPHYLQFWWPIGNLLSSENPGLLCKCFTTLTATTPPWPQIILLGACWSSSASSLSPSSTVMFEFLAYSEQLALEDNASMKWWSVFTSSRVT